MEKINFPRQYKVYIPLAALFVMMVFLMPRNARFNYDYRKGSPWMYETLIAQFDFPVLKTEQQLMLEKEKVGSEVIPYYRYEPKVAAGVQDALTEVDLGEYAFARSSIASALASVYSRGVLSKAVEEDGVVSSDGLIFVQKNRRAAKHHLSDFYTLSMVESYLLDMLREAYPQVNADSLLNASGISSLIVPDLIYDEQTTDLVHEENMENISHTQGVVRSGNVIVNEGEIVTAEIEQLLDSYKAEYDMSVGYNGPRALLWVGNIFLAFCIVALLFFAIFFCNYKIFYEYNKYLYLLLVFAISAVGSSVVAKNDPSLFYMMPFTLSAMYLLAFFKKRVVFITYAISLLPMLIFAPNGVELFIMYFVAGTVGMLVFGYFNRGWLQFVTALIVFVVMALIWISFRLVDGADGLSDYRILLDLALASLLSVAGYPLIYLFEKIFRLVSNSKLVELSDTSNTLLRMLADKAPGTFQHSLQVMNIADAAARAVNANVLLVRAGALYHDIGKINNPQCFTENETPGVKYHADLSPKESAQEIIKHVSDGLALAEKYGLPQEIKDFIITHHGTTSTGYFHTKYLNDGGDPDDVAEFFYDGRRPVTKEQVILMLCDTIEAASRSLKDYSKESISGLVTRIIDGKADSGQLSDSEMSIRDLNVLKEVISSYLQQMYHSRVVYPKRNNRRV